MASSPAPWHLWVRAGGLALVLATTGWAVAEGLRHVRAYGVAGEGRFYADKWASGEQKPRSSEELAQALAELQQASSITPDDPGLQQQLGDLHVVAAQWPTATAAERQRQLALAITHFQAAIALLPSNPQVWATLAMAYDLAGEKGRPMQQAWERALQLGPYEGHVQPVLLEVALANWAKATPQMQSWTKQLFAQSDEGQRKAFNLLAGRYGLRFGAQTAATPASKAP